MHSKKILQIKDLSVYFDTNEPGNWFFSKSKKVEVLSKVNIYAKQGEIVGIVGESGCGKTTLLRAILKMCKIGNGSIEVDGRDIMTLSSRDLAKIVQIVYQDPSSSLNPKFTALQIISEPLEILTKLSKKEITAKAKKFIELVGLPPNFGKTPQPYFSGGQAQRVTIARALIASPKIILCDEPLAALDISIQAQIVSLFKFLNKELNVTIVVVSHDLSVIEYLCDRVYGFYLGEVIEHGVSKDVFKNTLHPYIVGLLACRPKLEINQFSKPSLLVGEIPSIRSIPEGCRFHTRCPFVKDECKNLRINLEKVDKDSLLTEDSHYVRCIRAKEAEWKKTLDKFKDKFYKNKNITDK